jgi:hypothetical protein
MASVLDFERYKSELDRQMLRRIGYTNGLHKIRRFARVVEYLYPIMPTSAVVLAQIIIREENERGQSERPLKGTKYATGIVDIAQALTLLERFGRKIALSSQGYSCHALNERHEPESVLNAFLLEKVIESDGECALNILRIVSEGGTDAIRIGEILMGRLLALIDFKRSWAEEKLTDRFSQRSVISLLDEAQRTLERAIDPDKPTFRRQPRSDSESEAPIEFFYKHTVKPRLEWLEDLGCMLADTNEGLVLTDAGERLLSQVRELGGWHEEFILLPLDSWLSCHLGLPNFYDESAALDFGWKLVASTRVSVPGRSTIQENHLELLGRIKSSYSAVKLANFNEADALSIYEMLASEEAADGRVLSQTEFEKALTELVAKFPGEIFKLSKRRGRGLYIALKSSI